MNLQATAKYSKGNTALTLGIIGTALGAMNTVGNGFSLFGGNSGSKQRCAQAEDKCALEYFAAKPKSNKR